MTPKQFKAISDKLGLTHGELAKWLGLSDANGRLSVLNYLSGRRSISGPIARLMRAFDEGFVPPEYRAEKRLTSGNR